MKSQLLDDLSVAIIRLTNDNDHIDGTEPLRVDVNGELWPIYQGESGDIFAVNPKAEWSHEEDCFVIG